MSTSPTENAFDELTHVFDELIDWPRRLAAEAPFYRDLFERVGVRRVVDVACGTGRHAAMFHSWGLEVEGADVSPHMVLHARGLFRESPGLRWVVRGYDEAVEPAGGFDAAVCVGNSLALASDLETVERAVGRMLAAVRDGGVVIIHVLNLWALPEGPCIWHRSARATLGQNEVLLARGVHRCGAKGFVELVVADPSGEAPFQGRAAPFLGLEAPELDRMARAAGARQVSLFGGYQRQPYLRDQSVDLLFVAET